MHKFTWFTLSIILLATCLYGKGGDSAHIEKIDLEVSKMMKEGNIPGISLLVVKEGKQVIRTYGYADTEKHIPVTPATLFELGSCTKAFTALSVLLLEKQGKIVVNKPVTAYLPWFYLVYKGKKVNVTVLQLLYHTSGIPWHCIALIPESNRSNALEEMVRKISGSTVRQPPGASFEYSSLNYDVLGLIIEKVTGMPYEDFISNNLLPFLDMKNSFVGQRAGGEMAKGYKMGFFKARAFEAPVYRGNTPAAYIISDIRDMALWLNFQLGIRQDTVLYPLLRRSHQRDETVPPHHNASYAMGWEVSLMGDGLIYHNGLNPNFSSYVAFNAKDKYGIVLLANANSSFTQVLGSSIMKILMGDEIKREMDPDDRMDKIFSSINMLLGVYLCGTSFFLAYLLWLAITGKRKWVLPHTKRFVRSGMLLLLLPPFLLGIYFIPSALANFTWEAAIVWSPFSFYWFIVLMLLAVPVSYVTYFVLLFLPGTDRFKNSIPRVILVSTIAGIANMSIIILITSSLHNEPNTGYALFYYCLAFFAYILCRKYVQVNTIIETKNFTHDLRMKIINKIFSTSYQKFEKMDRGRVYTILNDDVGTVSASSNALIAVVPNIITIMAALMYLITIAFWAAILIFGIIVFISSIYYLASKRTKRFFEEARVSHSIFMRLLNSLIDGFKEISLNYRKKISYRNEVAYWTSDYIEKLAAANIRFVNAFLIGESLLILVLGFVTIAIPYLFPDLKLYAVTGFVMLLLYLIGPVKALIGSWPAIMELRIARDRIRKFIDGIPANIDISRQPSILPYSAIESIRAEDLEFRYREEGFKDDFSIGPVSLEVKKGEVLFIIGGNGSGKTTLAKLLTGLYQPYKGRILINGQPVPDHKLREYFSAVFSPLYLFDKIYGANLEDKSGEIANYLKLLGLEGEVEIIGNKFSTTNLSGGQRKRLALLECYLEDRPIYLFDEWAADQDPQYRHFFYRNLLSAMKEKGKIIIAITHDDHYFDVADKIIKMSAGKVDTVSENYEVRGLFDIDINTD